jgi:hypothetical protein
MPNALLSAIKKPTTLSLHLHQRQSRTHTRVLRRVKIACGDHVDEKRAAQHASEQVDQHVLSHRYPKMQSVARVGMHRITCT